jgi:Dolichyl-phosphate-mannose-protein mannosyltransferase
MSAVRAGPAAGRWLVALVVAAFALRLAWAFAVEVDPRRVFAWDMTFYDLAALRWADGALMRDFQGLPTAKWSPGWPLLLGSAYWLLGSGLWVAKLLNAALGALAVAFTGALGGRLFERRVGLGAAAALALLPGAVLYTPLLLSETAFVAGFAAVLWLACAPGDGGRLGARWLGLGALLGACVLVRGAAALFPAALALFWWLSQHSLATALRRSAALVLGMAVLVGPWVARNAALLGVPAISTQQMGMALTFAHSDAADGGMSMGMARFRDGMLRAQRELPQPAREVAEYRTEVRRALAWACANPGRELSLVPRRWLHLFAHDHSALVWATPKGEDGRPLRPVLGPRADRWIALGADAAFFALLALALVGLPACFARGARARLLLPITWAYFLALHGLLFAGDPRFHAPLYPVLAVLAAAGALGLADRARAARPAHSM